MNDRPTFIDGFTRRYDIERERSALIVVDMQNATGNRHLGLGKLLAERGQAEAAAYRFDRIENTIVPNIARLAEAFRDIGSRVIYVTYGANLADGSDVPEHIRGIVLATNNIEGQKEHEIVDALSPRPGELVLNKTTMGAFRSTPIESHLRALGIDTLVFTGVSTNNCVCMSLMEACDAQFKTVIVSDGTGTDSDAMQESTLATLRRLWARVMTTDEVIAELNRGTES